MLRTRPCSPPLLTSYERIHIESNQMHILIRLLPRFSLQPLVHCFSLFFSIVILRAGWLPSDAAAPEGCEVRREPLVSAWFGPAGTVSPLHNDPYHNVLVQVISTFEPPKSGALPTFRPQKWRTLHFLAPQKWHTLHFFSPPKVAHSPLLSPPKVARSPLFGSAGTVSPPHNDP